MGEEAGEDALEAWQARVEDLLERTATHLGELHTWLNIAMASPKLSMEKALEEWAATQQELSNAFRDSSRGYTSTIMPGLRCALLG